MYCWYILVNYQKKMKSSTLWSVYSMLRATLNIYNKVDIGTYLKLRAFLKLEAPDDTYLSTKVAMIFAVAGACRFYSASISQ
ncbi:hypothetical protein NQ315_006646 [Exocentrus adspersus]|uniref:Uncharacterized protein n=1 Tax=Exocentrus adspersus TaxID=1586481 RepID=A0AAV8VEM0_9CUCU|nr:hypothetical protein NQ315_006646 [Exocentrus adspersus]